jgi:predicted transcriptional regulator
MSTTITIRIPKELKDKMDKNPAQWSQEVRTFLEERVKQVEMLKNLQKIEKRADERKTKIDSTILIRKDRERQT